MSAHHQDLLVNLAAMREHISHLVAEVTEHARILTVVQQKVDALVAAVADEQAVDQSIVTMLNDIASQTSALVDPRRPRVM